MPRIPFLMAACLPLLLAACVPWPSQLPLPSGQALLPLTTCARNAPAAWSPDGRQIAFGRDGVVLRSGDDGRETVLAPDPPAALCWLDTRRIAAALPQDDGTELLLFEPGAPLRRVALPGRLNLLACGGDGRVLAVTTTLRYFSFGADLRSSLYRWDGEAPPREALLHDVTLKPQTARRWGEALQTQLQPALSPLKDELLLARLHDPPAFPPYLAVAVVPLAGGAERTLYKLPVGGRAPLWLDDERLLLPGGAIIDSWSGAGRGAGPLLPSPVAVAAGGTALFADGLLLGAGAAPQRLDGFRQGWFAPAGDRLLLQRGRRLYLLSGLPAAGAAVSGDQRAQERLLLLRRWRSQGLIDADDYRRLTTEPLP